MMRRLVIPLCCLAWGAALPAQDTSLAPTHATATSPLIHWGKWVTLGAAIGLTVAAVVQHNHAQDSWNQLMTLCEADNQKCALNPSGEYSNNDAELLYEETVYYDHLARRRLVLGQVSLLASVGMFVAELKRRQLAPPNIPLHGLRVLIEPLGRTSPGGVRLGVSLPF